MNSDLKCELTYQCELLTTIFNCHSDNTSPELQIYQNNLYMTAARSLSLSYPVVHKMIGEQAMRLLSRRLLSVELPSSGDWADWGLNFSALLAASELHQEHPYLAPMANLEWAFQCASRMQVEKLDAESLQRLTESDLDTVVIKLQNSLTLVSSDYPLHGLWTVHRNGDKTQLPTKADLSNALSTPEGGCYLVCQSLNGPNVVAITRDYFVWIDGIKSGKSIGKLLDEFPDFSFPNWLSESIKNNWLVSLA